MNSTSPDSTPPQELIAVVQSLDYSSSIAIVTFTSDDTTLQLFGDRRMTEPIGAYVSKLVRLFVRTEYDWSREPLEDPAEEEESE